MAGTFSNVAGAATNTLVAQPSSGGKGGSVAQPSGSYGGKGGAIGDPTTATRPYSPTNRPAGAMPVDPYSSTPDGAGTGGVPQNSLVSDSFQVGNTATTQAPSPDFTNSATGGMSPQEAAQWASSGGKGGATKGTTTTPDFSGMPSMTTGQEQIDKLLAPQAPSAAPQWNVNTAAAQGLQSAMANTGQAQYYQPQQVRAAQYNPYSMQATGYNAAQGQAQGYNAANAGARGYGAQGYNAANAGARGYNANTWQAGQLAGTNLNPYMNPYENTVIQGLQSDAARAQQMGSNQLGSAATAAKAFGGSRHGLAEGTMMAENQRNLNQQVGQLRQSGFLNAQQMAQQDIANRMSASQANQNALNQAGQFGAQAYNTAALQNAAAQNAARQFGAGAQNTAAQFGAGAQNTAALQNAAAQNAARQFGAGAQNAMTSQNLNALNAANQFGASAANTAAMQNQNAFNQAGQYNAGNRMTAQQLNQQAGLQGAQQRLGASNQLANMANMGFGMGQTINQNMMNQGAMQQALQQQVMNNARQQYQGAQNAPMQALSMLTQALGGTPYPQSQTQTSNAGMLDYLSLGAMMYGML